MSTDHPGNEPMQDRQPVGVPLSIRELTDVLIKHYGLHEGCYELIVEFQLGKGAISPEPGTSLPGLIFGVSKVGLIPSAAGGATGVDAAISNPAKKPLKKTKTG